MQKVKLFNRAGDLLAEYELSDAVDVPDIIVVKSGPHRQFFRNTNEKLDSVPKFVEASMALVYKK